LDQQLKSLVREDEDVNTISAVATMLEELNLIAENLKTIRAYHERISKLVMTEDISEPSILHKFTMTKLGPFSCLRLEFPSANGCCRPTTGHFAPLV
jgi:hypothetical protein